MQDRNPWLENLAGEVMSEILDGSLAGSQRFGWPVEAEPPWLDGVRMMDPSAGNLGAHEVHAYTRGHLRSP